MSEAGEDSSEESQHSADQSLPLIEYDYQPYSFIGNTSLSAIHTLTMKAYEGQDQLAAVRWLHTLTGYSKVNQQGQRQFDGISDNGSAFSNILSAQSLENATSLYLYTAARAQFLLRALTVNDDQDTDRGVSIITATALARLSNLYRIAYEESPNQTEKLLVAHDLAMYALRFKAPDTKGYSQSLGHWLQLHTDIHLQYRYTETNFATWAERLRLALALEELGGGPQALYVGKCLVPDLITLYKLMGEDQKGDDLRQHFEHIPITEQEPEISFKSQQRNELAKPALKKSRNNQRRIRS